MEYSGAMLTFGTPIETERLVLRPFTLDDLDDLYAIQSRPDVVAYLYWNTRSREEVRDVLRRKVEQTRLAEEGDALVLAVTLPGTEGLSTGVIGEVTLWWRSIKHRQGEIGFVMNPAHHGHGYATEAAAALLDIAFDKLKLHRVYGRTDGRNTASAALMRRLGMRQEAQFIHNEWFKGAWGEELVFAILESEWRTPPARDAPTASR